MARLSLARGRHNLPYGSHDELGFVELDVMATVSGDDQFAVPRERRQGGVVSPVLRLEGATIGPLVLRQSSGENDKRHVSQRVLALRGIGAQSCELFTLVWVDRRGDVPFRRSASGPSGRTR